MAVLKSEGVLSLLGRLQVYRSNRPRKPVANVLAALSLHERTQLRYVVRPSKEGQIHGRGRPECRISVTPGDLDQAVRRLRCRQTDRPGHFHCMPHDVTIPVPKGLNKPAYHSCIDHGVAKEPYVTTLNVLQRSPEKRFPSLWIDSPKAGRIDRTYFQIESPVHSV